MASRPGSEPELDDFPSVLFDEFEPAPGDDSCPLKRVLGDTFTFRFAAIAAPLQFSELFVEAVVTDPAGAEQVLAVEPANPGLDLWSGSVPLTQLGGYTVRLRGRPDRVSWYRQRIEEKAERGFSCRDELDGLVVLAGQLDGAHGELASQLDGAHGELASQLDGSPAELLSTARKHLAQLEAPVEVCLELARYLSTRLAELPSAVPTTTAPWVVQVAPVRALASAWYQFFPRSEVGPDGRHGTFETATAGLERAAEMGFDTVYLPPIHPIGITNRKGPGDTLGSPDDPGSPWAVGNADGGHDAINPALGDLAAFQRFLNRAGDLGLQVAMDYSLNFSPDHPWVAEHPEWFVHRTDGSLLPAGSVEKYYADILSVDYDGEYRHELLEACYDILEYWIGHGVRTFRVDLPHARSLTFWNVVFRRMRERHPDVVFLAEAFTKPKRQAWLSRLGFSQTLTYFLWRENAWEMGEYLTQLHGPQREFVRPNLFVNSHDYLPPYFQSADPEQFKARAAIAALGSPSWGVYAGFELLDSEPREPGSTKHAASEIFQVRPRDWSRAPLAGWLRTLNEIRRGRGEVRLLGNLTVHRTSDPDVLAFTRHGPESALLVLVAFTAGEERDVRVDLAAPPAEFGDLLTGSVVGLDAIRIGGGLGAVRVLDLGGGG